MKILNVIHTAAVLMLLDNFNWTLFQPAEELFVISTSYLLR